MRSVARLATRSRLLSLARSRATSAGLWKIIVKKEIRTADTGVADLKVETVEKTLRDGGRNDSA